jgi:hypothetical protein
MIHLNSWLRNNGGMWILNAIVCRGTHETSVTSAFEEFTLGFFPVLRISLLFVCVLAFLHFITSWKYVRGREEWEDVSSEKANNKWAHECWEWLSPVQRKPSRSQEPERSHLEPDNMFVYAALRGRLMPLHPSICTFVSRYVCLYVCMHTLANASIQNKRHSTKCIYCMMLLIYTCKLMNSHQGSSES